MAAPERKINSFQNGNCAESAHTQWEWRVLVIIKNDCLRPQPAVDLSFQKWHIPTINSHLHLAQNSRFHTVSHRAKCQRMDSICFYFRSLSSLAGRTRLWIYYSFLLWIGEVVVNWWNRFRPLWLDCNDYYTFHFPLHARVSRAIDLLFIYSPASFMSLSDIANCCLWISLVQYTLPMHVSRGRGTDTAESRQRQMCVYLFAFAYLLYHLIRSEIRCQQRHNNNNNCIDRMACFRQSR